VVFTVSKKLNCVMKRGKDNIDIFKRTDIVYKINCRDCDSIYIGQTKRRLLTRIKEHQANIKKIRDLTLLLVSIDHLCLMTLIGLIQKFYIAKDLLRRGRLRKCFLLRAIRRLLICKRTRTTYLIFDTLLDII